MQTPIREALHPPLDKISDADFASSFAMLFREELRRNDDAVAAFGHRGRWTRVATDALVEASKQRFPSVHDVGTVARNHSSMHRRSELLTFDILTYRALGEILCAIEHENEPKENVIRYQVWKLQSVNTRHRVLVAYWHGSRSGYFRNRESLEECVQATMRQCGRGPLVLLSACCASKPATAQDLAQAFVTSTFEPEPSAA